MILVIDDDDLFRSAFAASLRDDGFEVRDFAAALDVPSPDSLGEVDAVITDYHMAGMNGITFADAFHSARPDVPILLVSAFFSPSFTEQVAARAFLHFFRKPLDYDALLQVLRSICGARRSGA
jgi:DNA-binding NtrC family response regulator